MDRMSRMPVRWPSFWRGTTRSHWVTYPGLPSHPDHALAERYLPKGPDRCCRSAIKRRPPPEAGSSKTVEIFSHLANVGDAKSLVLHPASTTHQQMSAAQLAEAGIRRGPDPDFGRAWRIRTICCAISTAPCSAAMKAAP